MSDERIIHALELQLCIKRNLCDSEDETLVQLSKYVPSIQAPDDKYTVDSLKYYVHNPGIEKFETAFEICQFILPASHPYFLQLYLEYSKIPNFDPITLKKTAQYHAIRHLGIIHPKTSEILSGFNEDEYLRHLIEAEGGVEKNKKIQLYRKIIEQQEKTGRFIDCYQYIIRAVDYSEKRPQLESDEMNQYFNLLMIGMEVTYKCRKIEDMLKISEYLWNGIQNYCYDANCDQIMHHILYYCLKAYLESSPHKYYLLKLVMVLDEKMSKQMGGEDSLWELRRLCREAKNHINCIKQMLSKLQFGYR